jgi:hypothetical protein
MKVWYAWNEAYYDSQPMCEGNDKGTIEMKRTIT